MAKKTRIIEHESLQDTQGILTYLKAIQDGFKKGSISLNDEEEEILLSPEALCQIRIKAKRNKRSQELSLKISWSSEDAEQSKEDPLFIVAKKKSSQKD